MRSTQPNEQNKEVKQTRHTRTGKSCTDRGYSLQTCSAMPPGPSGASLFQLVFQLRIRINRKKHQCVDSPRTLAERGYGTRIRDEDVESPKARKERLCCPLSARRLAQVCDQHEHLRTRYSFEDCALSREEGHDTVKGTQRSAGYVFHSPYAC